MTGSTSGRSFLRPPSTVSRKSQSFNAADRNKIHDVTVGENVNNARKPPPAKSVEPPTERRSRSVNVKHSFTIQTSQNGIPISSKLPKKANPKETVAKKSSTFQQSKIGNGGKLTSSGKGKTNVTGVKSSVTSVKTSLSLTSPRGVKSSFSESRLVKPPVKNSKLPSKIKSGLIPPKASVSRSTSNSSRGSTATTATSPDRNTSNLKPKSSNSVLSRFRKKNQNCTVTKGDSTVKDSSKITASSANATSSVQISKEKRSLLPSSKFTTFKPKSNTSSPVRTLQPPRVSKNENPRSKLPEVYQRNFGGKDDEPLTKEVSSTTIRPPSLISQQSQISNHNTNVTIEGNEIIIVANDDVANKRHSNEQQLFKRDRIDVQNFNNLLVRPYDVKGHDPRLRHNMTSQQFDLATAGNDFNFSDSDDLSKSSAESTFGLFQKATKFPAKLDVVNDVISDENNHTNQEFIARNVQLPGPTDNRKIMKTATVAPFYRQLPDVTTSDEGKLLMQNDKERRESDGRFEVSTPKTISMEERRKTAKGIADLRQNLEETMINLRNSQLKNRLSDEFERHLSAQLDEVEETALPEVPPPLNSNTAYRSTEIGFPDSNSSKNNGLHTISHSTRSPKLYAGESLAQGSLTTPRGGKYGSMQRPLSGHKPRSIWEESIQVKPVCKSAIDDISSVSSGDISELITGISTEDISATSTDNSPHHVAAKPPPLPVKKSSLIIKKSITNSMESLDKSSSSTTESNRLVVSSLCSSSKPTSGDK